MSYNCLILLKDHGEAIILSINVVESCGERQEDYVRYPSDTHGSEAVEGYKE